MYQINIFRNTNTGDPVNMQHVQEVLKSAGIEFELPDPERDTDSIYTDSVSDAVRALNAAGYPTDEDDILNEED